MEYYKEANGFLRKYGSDAFKVIAAYEDAADVPQTERYTEISEVSADERH